jgi:hypothetical protein
MGKSGHIAGISTALLICAEENLAKVESDLPVIAIIGTARRLIKGNKVTISHAMNLLYLTLAGV